MAEVKLDNIRYPYKSFITFKELNFIEYNFKAWGKRIKKTLLNILAKGFRFIPQKIGLKFIFQ